MIVDVDVDHVGVATDRAISHIFLFRTDRQIDWNNDFLATGCASVAGFFIHFGDTSSVSELGGDHALSAIVSLFSTEDVLE